MPSISREFTPSIRWNKTADDVVIGCGGAGSADAITAHDNGSSDVILEKMPQPGGNMAVSAGGFMIPTDLEAAYKYLNGTYSYSFADYDETLLKTFCKGIEELIDRLTGLGENVSIFVYGSAGFKKLEGSETIKRYRIRGKKNAPRKGSGDCLYDLLKGALDKRNIPVMLNTRVTEMVLKGGQIVGVVAKQGIKKIFVCVRRGVVLTAGSYEFDPKSLQNFTMGNGIGAIGNPGNTGDGLRLAQSVGAKLWLMNAYSAFLGVRYPGYKTSVTASPKGAGYIWVD